MSIRVAAALACVAMLAPLSGCSIGPIGSTGSGTGKQSSSSSETTGGDGKTADTADWYKLTTDYGLTAMFPTKPEEKRFENAVTLLDGRQVPVVMYSSKAKTGGYIMYIVRYSELDDPPYATYDDMSSSSKDTVLRSAAEGLANSLSMDVIDGPDNGTVDGRAAVNYVVEKRDDSDQGKRDGATVIDPTGDAVTIYALGGAKRSVFTDGVKFAARHASDYKNK